MSCDLKLEYLLRDRPYDPAVAPADYDMLCVKSGGAELYGEILWPDGGFQGPRPCVLLCHGYHVQRRLLHLHFAKNELA